MEGGAPAWGSSAPVGLAHSWGLPRWARGSCLCTASQSPAPEWARVGGILEASEDQPEGFLPGTQQEGPGQQRGRQR